MTGPLAGVDPLSPVGTVVAAELDGAPVTVVRHDGGWVAVDEMCTHAACPFAADGEVFDGTVLACNCHGSEFDLRTGDARTLPAVRPVPSYSARVEGGRVLVDVAVDSVEPSDAGLAGSTEMSS